MKKRKLELLGFIMALGAITFNSNAQQKIGGTAAAADPNAYLQLGDAAGANKGLLLSRVPLTATSAASPLTAHVAGMVVYNTATAGSGTTAVTPGYYYNDGTKWVRIAATNDFAASAWIPGGNNNGSTKTIGTNDNYDLPFVANNAEKMRLTTAGNLGINTTTPATKLDIENGTTNGAIKIVDGTQGVNKVLTSDSFGVGTWKPATADLYNAPLGTGVDIPSTLPTLTYLYTGTSITLPPGTWLVSVTMILSKGYGPGAATLAGESWWVRSTFADNSTNNTPSGNILGTNTLISGALSPSSSHGLLTGSVVINNNTGAPKTYYYMGGRVDNSVNATGSLYKFGGDSNAWSENIITYQRINYNY